jgi:signal transduction histidine kinase
MERMAGRIGLDSVPGKGSRFWIELRSPYSE